MRELIHKEKIKFYVPERTDRVLRSDAEQFEIFKSNGEEINLNRFLTLLIVGYYNGYRQERQETAEALRALLAAYLKNRRQQEELTEKILAQVIWPEDSRRKGKLSVPLSLKPTFDTDPILTEIDQALVGTGDYLSRYLRRMLMSYCEKPIYERERIIFREKVAFLEEACAAGRAVSFTTPYNPKSVHHVMPWALVYGPEERFNYLLCQEYSKTHGRNMAVSYRLSRISRPSPDLSASPLEERIRQYLEQARTSSPQYALNEETETCVRLSERGQLNFRMIYFGRPVPVKIEKAADGSALYYFRASGDQLYRYFVRFQAAEAEVLYPGGLRKRLRRFYKSALKVYGKASDPVSPRCSLREEEGTETDCFLGKKS